MLEDTLASLWDRVFWPYMTLYMNTSRSTSYCARRQRELGIPKWQSQKMNLCHSHVVCVAGFTLVSSLLHPFSGANFLAAVFKPNQRFGRSLVGTVPIFIPQLKSEVLEGEILIDGKWLHNGDEYISWYILILRSIISSYFKQYYMVCADIIPIYMALIQ